MDITTISNLVSNQTEENFTTQQVMGFANDAIARINIECLAIFPDFDPLGANYTAFPDKWQRTLLVPFIIARVKQVDSSQFEYNDSFSEFQNNLNLFKNKYTVPSQYVDTDQSTLYAEDYSVNPFTWSPTTNTDNPWGV